MYVLQGYIEQKEFSPNTFTHHKTSCPQRAVVVEYPTTIATVYPSYGEEPQTVEHWLQRRPNAVALGQQLFCEPPLPLLVLTTNPGSVLVLVRKTLL